MQIEVINHLLRDPRVREYLVDQLLKKNLFQIGLKVKDKKTGNVWVLGSYDACCQHIWVNTDSGCTWGAHFPNTKNPFEILSGMNYEIVLPDVTFVSDKGKA